MYDFEDKCNVEDWELIITEVIEEYNDLTDVQKRFFSRRVYTLWSAPYTRMTRPEMVDVVRDLAEMYYEGIREGIKGVKRNDK